MDYKFIIKIVYVGNYIFLINDSIVSYTYDRLIKSINYGSYKVELTMFMRKLKLLKLIHKSEKELLDTVIYLMKVKPMNFDYQYLYPHIMKFVNIVPVCIIDQYNNDLSYIRKTNNIDNTNLNKILTNVCNDRKNLKNGKR